MTNGGNYSWSCHRAARLIALSGASPRTVRRASYKRNFHHLCHPCCGSGTSTRHLRCLSSESHDCWADANNPLLTTLCQHSRVQDKVLHRNVRRCVENSAESASGQGRPWPAGGWHSRSTPSTGNSPCVPALTLRANKRHCYRTISASPMKRPSQR